MTGKTYDQRCYDLAAVFLSDEPASINTEHNRVGLASLIQQTIEDEIAGLRPPIKGIPACGCIVFHKPDCPYNQDM